MSVDKSVEAHQQVNFILELSFVVPFSLVECLHREELLGETDLICVIWSNILTGVKVEQIRPADFLWLHAPFRESPGNRGIVDLS